MVSCPLQKQRKYLDCATLIFESHFLLMVQYGSAPTNRPSVCSHHSQSNIAIPLPTLHMLLRRGLFLTTAMPPAFGVTSNSRGQSPKCHESWQYGTASSVDPIHLQIETSPPLKLLIVLSTFYFR